MSTFHTISQGQLCYEAIAPVVDRVIRGNLMYLNSENQLELCNGRVLPLAISKDNFNRDSHHQFPNRVSDAVAEQIRTNGILSACHMGGEHYINRNVLLETDIDNLTSEDFLVSLPEGKYGILRDTIDKGTEFDIIVGRVIDNIYKTELPTGMHGKHESGDWIRAIIYQIPVRNRDRLI